MRVPLAVRAIPKVAEKVWWRPPHISSLSLEGVLAAKRFDRVTIEWEDRELHGFKVGEGPLVVLVHGWGGQAAQMAPLAEVLAAGGFTAVALDLPGHGTDRRPRSDAFQMASAVRALIASVGHPVGVVTHSLGFVAALMGFDKGLPERTILLAPVLDIEAAVSVFAERAQLFPWTAARVRSSFRKFVGDEWWSKLTKGSDADLGVTDLLVVHDVGDRDTPFDTSAALGAKHPGADFVATSGLGHNRILADESVGEAASGFLARSARHSSQIWEPQH